jgi:hypothetical protein
MIQTVAQALWGQPFKARAVQANHLAGNASTDASGYPGKTIPLDANFRASVQGTLSYRSISIAISHVDHHGGANEASSKFEPGTDDNAIPDGNALADELLVVEDKVFPSENRGCGRDTLRSRGRGRGGWSSRPLRGVLDNKVLQSNPIRAEQTARDRPAARENLKRGVLGIHLGKKLLNRRTKPTGLCQVLGRKANAPCFPHQGCCVDLGRIAILQKHSCSNSVLDHGQLFGRLRTGQIQSGSHEGRNQKNNTHALTPLRPCAHQSLPMPFRQAAGGLQARDRKNIARAGGPAR